MNLLLEETQGNPFFLEEIYRQLLDNEKIFDDTGEFRSDIDIDEIEIPDNVLLVLTRWLADLTEHEKRILAAAAVVGRSFSFQLLSALSKSNLDELFSVMHKGQQMGILVASPQASEMGYVFTNELVRQSLLSYVSASRYVIRHSSSKGAISITTTASIGTTHGSTSSLRAKYVTKNGSAPTAT